MWQYTHGYTFLFIDRMDGVSNCAQAETTAELHQGLLLNFLKKIHVLEEKGWCWMVREGWKWGKRNRKKILEENLTFLSGGACFVMPHMECFWKCQ